MRPQKEWDESTAGVREEAGTGRWVPQILGRPPAALVAPDVYWEGMALSTRDDAVTYASIRRRKFIEAARKIIRRMETVNLPEDTEPDQQPAEGPQEPSQDAKLANWSNYPSAAAKHGWGADIAETPWDGDWGNLTVGTRGKGNGFEGTLHDPRGPYAVRWGCGHEHPTWHNAETCALHARRRLVNEAKEKLAHPGLDVTHPGGMKAQSTGGLSSGPPVVVSTGLKVPPLTTVNVTPDAGVIVRVKAHRGSRVSTHLNEGGALEVVITPPAS